MTFPRPRHRSSSKRTVSARKQEAALFLARTQLPVTREAFGARFRDLPAKVLDALWAGAPRERLL